MILEKLGSLGSACNFPQNLIITLVASTHISMDFRPQKFAMKKKIDSTAWIGDSKIFQDLFKNPSPYLLVFGAFTIITEPLWW